MEQKLKGNLLPDSSGLAKRGVAMMTFFLQAASLVSLSCLRKVCSAWVRIVAKGEASTEMV